jgi:predicted amino acid-binding ACT domain protein
VGLGQALGPESNIIGAKHDTSPLKSVGMHFIGDHTAIELTGTDRPGLLSDIFAVLKDSGCNVIAAEVWTHRMRIACVVYVNDVDSGKAVDGSTRLEKIEEQLKNLLRVHGNDSRQGFIFCMLLKLLVCTGTVVLISLACFGSCCVFRQLPDTFMGSFGLFYFL